MKDNTLIPKRIDEMHPSVHLECEDFGMMMPLIQMLAGIQKGENWRDP